MTDRPQFDRQWFIPLPPLQAMMRQMIYAEGMRRLVAMPSFNLPDDPFDPRDWLPDTPTD